MTSDLASRAVVEAFQKGPAVLLVGQSLFPAAPAQDKPLPAWWLEQADPALVRAQHVRRFSDAQAVSDQVRAMLELAWSVVIASGFDSTIARALAISDRRTVLQIVTDQFGDEAADVTLRLLRLFGTVDRDSIAELPPSSLGDLRTRRLTATNVLSRLPTLVTPSGKLLIDSWRQGDWLRPRDLATALASFTEGQVHIFGAGRGWLDEDEDFLTLREEGVVTLHERPLHEVVGDLVEQNELPERATTFKRAACTAYQVLKARLAAEVVAPPTEEQLVEVSFESIEWRDLSFGQIILVDLRVTRPLPDDESLMYDMFRQFIATGADQGNLQWLRHLVFRRNFMSHAVKTALDIARQPAPQEHLLLLRGQSGSGKSVALALLAVEMRELGFPVIYIPPTTFEPDRRRIERFVESVSQQAEVPAFVFYDGLKEEDAYLDISQFFASRLRKCVIVGTCYTFHSAPASKSRRKQGRKRQTGAVGVRYVDVTVDLDDAEVEGLIAHLHRFVGVTSDLLRKLAGAGINNFFAVVYHALPSARRTLEERFIRECLRGGEFVQTRSREMREEDAAAPARFSTTVGDRLRASLGAQMDALINAVGVPASAAQNAERPQGAEPTKVQASTADAEKKSRQLFDLVMLASHLGQNLPQSVALRMLGLDFHAYRGSFTAGLLVEREVAPSVYALSARSSIEASIWVQRHLGNPEEQMRVLELAAAALSAAEIADDHSPETNFLVAALQSVGPNGPQKSQLRAQYGKIANIVADQRARVSDVSVRFLLLEANATREWILLQQRASGPGGTPDLAKLMARLDDAERALREAFDRVYQREGRKPKAAARRMLATLATELACVLGTKIGCITRYTKKDARETVGTLRQVDDLLEKARTSWQRSWAMDDSNRMSVDSACWIIKDRFGIGFNSDDDRLRALALWADVLDRYRLLDLTDAQEDRRAEREIDYNKVQGRRDQVERLVATVRARGSSAADILLARHMLYDPKAGAEAACRYLDDLYGRDRILADELLLSFYLRAWWQKKTGADRFFPFQRQILKFDAGEWTTLLNLVNSRLVFEPEHSAMLFLRAVALVHLDQVVEAVEVLRDLDRMNVGGVHRSKALFLRTASDGTPIKYSAVFQGRRRGNVAEAWCDELRQNVTFIPQEFGRLDIRSGSNVGPFHLAITYRNLAADPTSRLRDR